MDSVPVLVVDDDAGARELMAMALRLCGFSAIEHANGQEALKYLHAGGGARAILLDLMMPVMNGFEFRRQQLEDPRLARIPVVVLSALASLQTEEIAPAAALNKPVDVFEVVKVVRGLSATLNE